MTPEPAGVTDTQACDNSMVVTVPVVEQSDAAVPPLVVMIAGMPPLDSSWQAAWAEVMPVQAWNWVPLSVIVPNL